MNICYFAFSRAEYTFRLLGQRAFHILDTLVQNHPVIAGQCLAQRQGDTKIFFFILYSHSEGLEAR